MDEINSFEELDINYEYNSNRNFVYADFFNKILPHCNYYKRFGGIFSGQKFVQCAEGLQDFIKENDGTMQLAIIPVFDEKDKEAFSKNSREQIITDVESINLFLIDSGVPPSSIHMINKYPNSTYQNIMVVKKYIDKYDVKSIIFLTSPYHSLRSSLLWKENAKDINVTIPDLRKPVNNNVKWGIKLDRIIVILYEYTSIMYNWFLGRL